MNNDKKEILDELLKYFKESNINGFGYEQDKLISYEEAQIILDYITNLQEENKNRISESLSYDLVKAKIKDLEYKIDKAIEYIKEHNVIATNKEYMPKEYEYCCSADLLNILEGEDKE